MTDSPDEYGEVLRRVLRAEADSVMPSAEGLEIIRTRIDQRGLRGIFWWRAAASVAGAVLVAATIVMVVPNLREQFTNQRSIVPVQFDTSPPDESSTRRPPNVVLPPISGSTRPTPSPTATTTPLATPTPTVTTSPGDDCTGPVPKAVEPDGAESPQSCATPMPSESQPGEITKPDPAPTPTPTPTKTTPKPTVKPTKTPTADPTPDACQTGQCLPTVTPAPSISTQMTADGATSIPQP